MMNITVFMELDEVERSIHCEVEPPLNSMKHEPDYPGHMSIVLISPTLHRKLTDEEETYLRYLVKEEFNKIAIDRAESWIECSY